jgi:hypothetical protein
LKNPFARRNTPVPKGASPAHVHWLLPFQLPSLASLGQVSLASARLRAGIALRQPSDDTGRDIRLSAGDVPDRLPAKTALVIGKPIMNDDAGRPRRWLDAALRVRRSGGTVIVDYTDDHLSADSAYGPFYESIFDLADHAITPSVAMQQRLCRHWDGRITVIEDAVETEALAPRVVTRHPPAMLWFGHESNLPYLLEFLEHWRPGSDTRVLALSAAGERAGTEDWAARNSSLARVEFREWSLPGMVSAAHEADICIIPSAPGDVRKSGVSSNRLVTALALGLPAAADDLESYLEFRDYYVSIRSREFGRLVADPAAFHDRVLLAQRAIVPAFQPGALARKWRSFLRQVAPP